MRIADFDYELPPTSIAQEAIEPRDAARLLVAHTLEDKTMLDLPQLLSSGDLLVVNRTRVRAARIRGTKASTGGAIEALLLRRLDDVRWEALLRPARRIRTGAIFDFGVLSAKVLTPPKDGVVTLALSSSQGDVEDVLAVAGEVPLPPYFHGTLAHPERYQTMFAKTVGSAAAPTAGLHFTPRLAETLASAGIGFAEVELEVGLDTFRPMTAETLDEHEIHRERYLVPAQTAEAVATTRDRGHRVVAVGTTVVRTLESAAAPDGSLVAGEGESDLFIAPGYEFRVIDALITNYHAPRTTLIVLVAALLGQRWGEVYRHAVDRGYRFLSFGDALLIDRRGHDG